MNLGIMQPYFFPYLGHFALIAQTDRWVVFDISQYTPKTWINRNRILHPNQGAQYITVPLDGAGQSHKISEVRVLDLNAAKTRILGQLQHYKKHAPYFKAVTGLVEATFASSTSDSLTALNVKSLKSTCEYLDLPFDFLICSKDVPGLPEKTHPGGWALEICSLLGASGYLNPYSGRELFKAEEFRERKIALRFLPQPQFAYDCTPYTFEPHLSILDVLMWNSPADVRKELFKPVPLAAETLAKGELESTSPHGEQGERSR